MNEKELRVLACEWLKRKYHKKYFLIPLMIFHNYPNTLTDYLKRNYYGNELKKIPHYNELMIRPDLIGLMNISKEGDIYGWIIGEVKSGKIVMKDFRQTKHYMTIAHPYEGFCIYDNGISREVKSSIRGDNHAFEGVNKWGNLAKKRITFIRYEKGKFRHERIRR